MSTTFPAVDRTVDPSVDFDFGEGSPAENINAEQFSIAWSGSIVARETGVHEFRVRTGSDSIASHTLMPIFDQERVLGLLAGRGFGS